jgi:hypothetical protein
MTPRVNVLNARMQYFTVENDNLRTCSNESSSNSLVSPRTRTSKIVRRSQTTTDKVATIKIRIKRGGIDNDFNVLSDSADKLTVTATVINNL